MAMQGDDDIHHSLHAFFTGETDGYYSDFGSAATLVKAFTKVFVHDGGWSSFRNQNWGAPVDVHSTHYDAASFVSFIQDHDQVGNRAAGDRRDTTAPTQTSKQPPPPCTYWAPSHP